MAKKKEIEEPKFTPYPIKEGDRFDTVAQKAYGDATYVHTLILDNPHLQTKVLLPPGEFMWVRIKTDPETGALLPPWFLEDEETETGGEGGVIIPPVTDGTAQLGFSAGYPKVVGNKIHFAINKSGYYAYSVELSTGGGVIVSSPTYLFTENVAVITRDINESGLYVVKVGNLTSGNIPIYGAGDLAFVRLPEITKGVEFYQLKYSVNKNGIYLTKIINLATGSPVYSADVTYTAGTDNTIPVQVAGVYELQIGDTLKADFEATEGGTGTAPEWMVVAGYRYDINSHDLTLDLGASADIEVSVIAAAGANPSGITQDGDPWNSTTYNPGRNNFVVAPVTEWFSFRPAVAGSGGIAPGSTYKILIRRTADKGDVFTMFFTAPMSSTPPGVTVNIDLEGSTSNTCALGPIFTSVIEIDKDSAEWTQDASGVKTVVWRVKDTSDSSVVRSGTVTIINSNGQAVFNPSNQPKVAYSELPEGDYEFEIEGGNCSSDVSSHEFSVTGSGGGTACTRRPTISGSLKSATKNRVSWVFDGEGIYSLKWWVDDTSGSRLRSGTVDILTGGTGAGSPVFSPSNTPFVTFSDLPDGTYKFGIRGGNCDSTPDEVNFTVSSDSTTLPPSTEVGLLLAEAGGKKFRWIDDKDIRLTITTDGKTKISAPLTRQSWNGQRTCNLWMLNDWFKFVRVDAKNALLGAGENLPNGSYYWAFYYINPSQGGQPVTNFAQLQSGQNMWLTFGDPAQHEYNSGQISHLYLEVVGNKPAQSDSSIVRVWKPDTVQGCSWIGQYQYTNETINLPGLKWLGMSKRQWEPSLEHLFTQISGIQWEYDDVNWIQPYDKGWANMRSYGDVVSFPWSGTVLAGGSVNVDRSTSKALTNKIIGLYYAYSGGIPGGCGVNVSIPSNGTIRFQVYNNTGSPVTFSGGNLEARIMASVQEAVDYLGNMRDGHVGMSQITEDGMPFDKIEEIMSGLYDREKARRPTLTMDQWNLFYDYFARINAYSTELDIDNKEFGISVCRESLATQEGGRKMIFLHEGPPTFEPSYYFRIHGALGKYPYQYRHRGVNGYLGGMYGLKNGTRVYDLIFNIEKQYCALDTRQVLVYGTILGEGIENRTERRGCWPRLPIPSPKGDVVRLQFNTFGFHLFENECFLTLFLAEKYVVWDDNGKNGQDIRDWGPGYYGGFDAGKTQWQAEGQGLVVWDNNNPSHPHPISTPGNIAAVVRVADNGIFSGAWIYDQIKNYCNQSRRYARHNYVDSTGAHSGYPWGDIPHVGSRGTSEMHTKGAANYGQDNIIDLYINDLPIVMEGKGDSGYFIYCLNMNAAPNENTRYNITLSNGMTKVIDHIGCRAGHYKITV